MEAWGRWMRTVGGQLTLFGILFAGAAVLALSPWLLRDRVFSYYAKEAYPKLDGYAETALPLLTRKTASEKELDEVFKQLRKRDDTEGKERFLNLERMYGQWMEDEDQRVGGWLARRLTATDRRWVRDWTIPRLRTTFAAGNVNQRRGAVAWIAAALREKELPDRDELRQMLEKAKERATRRGEMELADEAAAALAPDA